MITRITRKKQPGHFPVRPGVRESGLLSSLDLDFEPVLLGKCPVMLDSEPQSLVRGFSEQLQRKTRGLNVVLPQDKHGHAVVEADLSRLQVVDGELPGEAELRGVLADEDHSGGSNLFLYHV